MKSSKLSNLFKIAATAIGVLSATGQAAHAFDLAPGTSFSQTFECWNDSIGLVTGKNPTDANGWQYAIDSNTDGANGRYGIGSAPGQTNPFDFSGIAIKQTATSVIVAINSNMPLAGSLDDGHLIGYSDLFFTMPGENFAQAMQSGNLYGIHFASANHSGVQQLGVYSNVQAKTVTDLVDGYTSSYGGITRYENDVKSLRGTPSHGDLTSSYFTNNGQNQKFDLNAIKSGTYFRDISFLAQGTVTQDLLATGYDTTKFKGTQTIAFQFNKSAVTPTASVPEPSTLVALGSIGLALAASKSRKQTANANKA